MSKNAAQPAPVAAVSSTLAKPPAPATPKNAAQPAWHESTTVPVSLVLEGGGMRGQFSAGVLDFFMDKKLFCRQVIGVSAGALTGFYYVAGAPGRSCYQNMTYCTDWRYLSLKSFVRTGNAYGREFAFDEIPHTLDPFDFEWFNNSPMNLITVASNLETGEADYHHIRDAESEVDYLIASSSMPLVSRIVNIDGKQLLDGGTTDSVPLAYSLRSDVRKHIVVLTREQGYEKRATKLAPLLRQVYAPYPYYLERLLNRHYDYNRTYRFVDRAAQAGEIFVIRPQKPVTINKMERDPKKLFDLYQQGVFAAACAWPALEKYLEA